jgi:putative ABC transport system permease protein
MLRNYLKIAWRNLIKHRVYSLINIIGLSVSVSFCLLLYFYIRHEQSYDGFHEKKDRLFRLEMTNLWAGNQEKPKAGLFSFLTRGNDQENALVFPVIVAGDLQNRFPQVLSITRLSDWQDHMVFVNRQGFKVGNALSADNNFFTNFSFPLLKGDPKTALKNPRHLVLTASAAKRFFGARDPIGRTISLASDSSMIFTVSGIAADAPANSSIQFDLVWPVLGSPNYDNNIRERFNHGTHSYIVELAEGIHPSDFEKQMDSWVMSYFSDYFKYFKSPDLAKFHLYLRPLTDCHYNVSGPWGHFTNAKNIYQLSCLVIVILLIACLNYVLLAISNAASRSQEVGVRKVMGARRLSVIAQFWVETQILVVLAVMAGFLLTGISLPLLNRVMDCRIGWSDLSWTEVLPALLILCLGMGLLAGYYPAWVISRMKPVSIMQSFQTFRINPRFSRILIVVQYTACVTLMVAGLVINLQMRYISEKDLGFDKDQILLVKNPVWDVDFGQRVNRDFTAFAATRPDIRDYTGIAGGLDGGGNENGFILHGEQKWLLQISVGYDYFRMLDLKLVQGRLFSPDILSDSSRDTRPSVVNETLFHMLGKDAKLNVYNETLRSTIIGVVKDYHFQSLSQKIGPLQHVLAQRFYSNFLFKLKGGRIPQSIAAIQMEWKAISNNYPFEYEFLDQKLAHLYESEMRWQAAIQASCFFAILISCLGLFGLSAINAINRTREIGIRKVMGAGVFNLVGKLSTGFLQWVALSIVLAAPLSWWIMERWLEDFAYRITLSWWMFVSVGILALLLAGGTVSYQALKAARANPIKSLRTE